MASDPTSPSPSLPADPPAPFPAAAPETRNFIHEIIDQDLSPGGRFEGRRVHTRFPPEPNGYLHIGHAKAICIDFGTAERYGGLCNLRMDDTNPSKEDTEYVESIQEDIRWLGYDWEDRFYYASDYFPRMFDCAVELVRKGLAYVCDLTAEEVRASRGTLTEPGTPSPYRDRSVAENLDLFHRMRAGEFPDGSRTLRARIDMASGNMNMRDPVLYRILRATHHRTGDAWCLYPMYDFAHPLEDAFERITHSLCSLEFEDHRPLYDWVIEHVDLPERPRQVEFARLNLNWTVMSKRKLLKLVTHGHVDGWDDPRMPTLCGLRRRGYTPASIRAFIDRVGVSKINSTVDHAFLEHCLREDLNRSARRVMAVLHPIRLVLTNYPEGQVEWLPADNNPERPEDGSRLLPFSRELWIEADDFMAEPVKGYFRLFPGGEVRLKHAYLVRCTGFDADPDGRVRTVRAEIDPLSRGGDAPDGRKVRGTLHWVSVAHGMPAEVRLYGPLFRSQDPSAEADFTQALDHDSLEILSGAVVEPSLAGARAPVSFQFMRLGYFCPDSRDCREGRLVFNRSVSLKDSWKPGKPG